MWSYSTPKGVFYIIKKTGRFHVIYDDEDLGSYATPQQAVDDVSAGHTFWPSSGIDPGELGISDDLGDWEYIRW